MRDFPVPECKPCSTQCAGTDTSRLSNRFRFLFTLIMLPLILSIQLPAQEAFQWNNYASMRSISAGISDDEGIWAGSDAGVFYFSFTDSAYLKLMKSNGLNGSPVTAITIDNSGKVWIGNQNGSIDVYNPNTGSIKNVLDIYNSDKSRKKIIKLRVFGDTVFAAAEFGVSLIDPNTYSFYDTYLKFGDLPANTQVTDILKHDKFFIATPSGAVVQKEGAVNLNAPESWEVFTEEGLPSDNITNIGLWQGNVLLGTERGFAQYTGSGFTPVLEEFNGRYIRDFYASGDSLYVLFDSLYFSGSTKSFAIYHNGAIRYLLSPVFVNTLLGNRGNETFIGTGSGVWNGLVPPAERIILPNGPRANLFVDMTVDEEGTLWVASGRSPTGEGFYTLGDGFWTNYNIDTHPELPSNFFFNVHRADDGMMYFGSYGRGFISYDQSGNVKVYNAANTPLTGIADDPDYLVISDIKSDSKGNIWVLNFEPADKLPLSVLNVDSTWYQYQNSAGVNVSAYQKLLIDQYDTKWFISDDRTGLYYFNENETPGDNADDRYGLLNQSDGLNGESVNDFALDTRGDLWIGTSLGVDVIYNVSAVTGSDNPVFRTASVFGLRQQNVTCLAVDPINRKWIGTTNGLLLVSDDGNDLIAEYNTSNSGLLSDEIQSIAIDENSGTVYVGTENGLTSFSTNAVQPADSYSDIFLYPNPYIVGVGNQLTIEGLMRDTEIKILTLRGKLVRHIVTPGGRVGYWDGKDEDGALVSSGIYILIAFDSEGNNLATEKVAVIRK